MKEVNSYPNQQDTSIISFSSKHSSDIDHAKNQSAIIESEDFYVSEEHSVISRGSLLLPAKNPPPPRSLIVALLISLAASQVVYSNIATFLPPYRTLNHKTLGDTSIGVIIAFFQVAIILASPCIGVAQQAVGRKNVILIGYMCAVLGCTMFGLISHIDNDYYSSLFLLFAMFIRFMQGFGSACIQVSVFSVVAIHYPDDKSRYFGWCESATGVGLMSGPIFGQVFYSAFGFEGCFYSTAFILAMAATVSLKFIPNLVNKGRDKEDSTTNVSVSDERLGDVREALSEGGVSYKSILMNRRAVMSVLSCILATVFLLFSEPIISDQLIRIGVSDHFIAPFVGMLSGYMGKETITLVAFGLSTLAILIQGPSKILGFNESIGMTVTGFIMVGATEAFIFVPLMPLIIEAVIESERRPLSSLNTDLLNDRASSVFQGAQAIGCILGPIIGGFTIIISYFNR